MKLPIAMKETADLVSLDVGDLIRATGGFETARMMEAAFAGGTIGSAAGAIVGTVAGAAVLGPATAITGGVVGAQLGMLGGMAVGAGIDAYRQLRRR